uniref:RNA binding motif protein 34 n=1 Tax=Scleropages formosus TaxID=113540 RepID=A0A8C9QXK0_SCLFO
MSAVAESGHYVVGQVSGSLFPNKSTSDACKSSSLSALFQRKSSAPKNADKEEEMKKSRKIKRKAVGGGEMSLEEGEEPRKKRVINKAEEQIKSRRTVFVGNLPTNCTKKMLKVLFREFGAIESIRFRSVTREDATMSHKVAAIQRKVHPKRQSINSYVVFKDQDSAVRALKRNGMEIAKDFHIRVDLASKANSHNHKQSVFVGNLPYEVNELTVRQHFEQCGGIEAIRLVRDRDSGMGKGFGYVLFENVDAVQLALKLNNSELQGRKIRVKRSVKNVEKASGVVNRNKKTATPPERCNTKGVGRPSHRPKNKSSTPASQKQGKVQGGSSFRGEIAKPGNSRSKKNKGLKKKFRSKK